MTAQKIHLCKEKGCKNAATTAGFCRLHYLKNWKTVKEGQKTKAVKSLNKYIDFVMKSNPKDYVESIRNDLRDQEQFTRKADGFMADDDFHDVMDEVGNDDIVRIIGAIKIDDSF